MNITINPKVFNKIYKDAYYNKLKSINFIYGGSSSGKTFSAVQFAIFQALEGRAILAIRETMAQARKTIFIEIKKEIDRLNLNKYFDINLSNMKFVSNISKGEIAVLGTDNNAENIKGVTPVKAKGFSLAIIDEISGISKESFIQIKIRMRGDPKFPTQIIGLFNPISIEHYIFQDYILPLGFDPYAVDRKQWEYSKDDTYILRTNYKDNDHLDDDTISNLEQLGADSKYYEQVYLNAEPGVFGNIVYNEVKYIEELPFSINDLPLRIGIDTGFKDLMCMTISRYDKDNNIIYIIDSLAENNMLPEPYAKLALSMLEKHDINPNTMILSDPNNPIVNKLLKRGGLTGIIKALKPPGSKLAGILWLKTRQIHCLKSLKGMVSSFGSYVWKDDKEDTAHTGSDRLDAMRYSYSKDFNVGQLKFSRGQ